MIYDLKLEEMIICSLEEQDSSLNVDFGIVTQKDSSHEYYEGDYVITPKVESQIMLTSNKVMSKDVSIKGIPKYEVDNQKGTTVYIGSELNG